MENDFTFGVLIPTINDNIGRVKKDLLPVLNNNPNIDEVVISHQIFDDKTKPSTNLTQGKVKYLYTYDKGSAKNRNNALKHITTDIVHFCDDDIIYSNDFSRTIKSAHIENKDCDIITFEIKKGNQKAYRLKHMQNHNLLSILIIGTVGITIKRKAIANHDIWFNEDYGVGAKWQNGEDTIFLSDSYKRYLTLIHYDMVIATHDERHSGNYITDDRILCLYAVFRHIFGYVFGLLALSHIYVSFVVKRKQKLRFSEKKYSVWDLSRLFFLSFYNYAKQTKP